MQLGIQNFILFGHYVIHRGFAQCLPQLLCKQSQEVCRVSQLGTNARNKRPKIAKERLHMLGISHQTSQIVA